VRDTGHLVALVLWPLRPELAALLGVCPLSQLTQGVGGSSRLLLSGGVAVLCCCIGSLLDSAKCSARARRPSAFQAGHIPSWHRSCESYALSPVAGACRWLLLLLSPLLSAPVRTLYPAAPLEFAW
jgi:hypothetical protein